MTALRIGTRGSALALAQTGTVADAIRARTGIEVEVVTVTTHGDTSREPLSAIGGTGVFANALRQALAAGECDLAVHSMKDLPTAPVEGIALAAVPRRADARDAVCARDGLTLEQLPSGARVGTGSPRRVAQLRAERDDLEVVDLRGNVETRLGRVLGRDFGDPDRLDAVILAAAGLERVGRGDDITQRLDLTAWPTAPAQGALAVEARSGAAEGGLDVAPAVAAALARLNHTSSRAAAHAERAVLAGLEAGCAAPVGVTALVDDGLFFVTATVYRTDGTQRITSSHAASLEGAGLRALLDAGDDAAARVVAELLDAGAAKLAPLKGSR